MTDMQQIRWRTFGIETIATVAAILLAVVAISIGYALAWPISIKIGENDSQFIENFYDPEIGEGQIFRWTAESSQLHLPQPPLNTPVVLMLHIQDSRQVRPEQPQLRVQVGDRELARFPLSRSLRTYYLLVPPMIRPDKSLTIQLQSAVIQENDRGRGLGVAVFDVALSPTRESPWLPSIWVGLCAAFLGSCTYATARLIGVRRLTALIITAGAVILVGFGIAARPLEILPFVQRFTALAVIACLGVVIARLLVPTAQVNGSGADDRTRPPRSLVSGSHLPIYLAISFWMFLLFQEYMAWDGAINIGAPTWDFWIGGGIVIALGIGLPAWRAIRGRNMPLAQRQTTQTQIALVVLGLASVIHIGFNFEYVFTHQAADFWVHFKAVREWARGGVLYNLSDITDNRFGKVFKLPPFYALIFIPFVETIGGEVMLLWYRVLNAGLIGLVALIWLRMWRLPVRSLSGVALLILLSFRPLFDTLTYGQLDLILLCLLTLTLWALREDRAGLAGALIALATILKLYPIIILAFFVIKRRWAGLWGFALGMLILNTIALLVMGWDVHWIYLTQVLPIIGGTTAWAENQTISGFLARFAESPKALTLFEGRGLGLAGTLISGTTGLAVCALALRPTARRSPAEALQYCMFLLVMVLCVPAAWMHYEALLVIVFAALLLHLRDQQVSVGYAVALGLSFALIAYGNQWAFFNGTVIGILTLIGISYKFYGMVLLGGLIVAALLTPTLYEQ